MNIGEIQREVTIEPFPESAPIAEPVPESEPVVVPEPEKVPA